MVWLYPRDRSQSVSTDAMQSTRSSLNCCVTQYDVLNADAFPDLLYWHHSNRSTSRCWGALICWWHSTKTKRSPHGWVKRISCPSFAETVTPEVVSIQISSETMRVGVLFNGAFTSAPCLTAVLPPATDENYADHLQNIWPRPRCMASLLDV